MKNNNTSALVYLLPGACYLLEYLLWKSLPQSHALNGLLGGLWTAGQAGILFILASLYRQRIFNGNKWKLMGTVIAALGAIAYSINYIFGYWLHMNTRLFLPLGALLTGIGMVIVGVQVLMARSWRDPFRFMPLAVGLYPFLVMFPLLLITGRPDLTAILCWGIPWLLLGIGMSRSEKKRSSASNRFRRMIDITHIL
ncbi:MAG TPA: hypothetical protein VFR58_06455 [Flavisolibacter sp.]|nr:hypothetical protein [Flavisolibacter sp.]